MFSHVLFFSLMTYTSFGLKCWSDKIKGKGSSRRSWDTFFPHLHCIKICPLGGPEESITQMITFFHTVTLFLPTALLSKHAPIKDNHSGFYLYLYLKQFQQENYWRFIITRYFYAPPLSDTQKERLRCSGKAKVWENFKKTVERRGFCFFFNEKSIFFMSWVISKSSYLKLEITGEKRNFSSYTLSHH